MNLFLYLSVVVIWGTTWIAIYAQQAAVLSPSQFFGVFCWRRW